MWELGTLCRIQAVPRIPATRALEAPLEALSSLGLFTGPAGWATLRGALVQITWSPLCKSWSTFRTRNIRQESFTQTVNYVRAGSRSVFVSIVSPGPGIEPGTSCMFRKLSSHHMSACQKASCCSDTFSLGFYKTRKKQGSQVFLLNKQLFCYVSDYKNNTHGGT